MKWLVLCNGGPPDADGCTTVGANADSLGKACGRLESMMKALNASFGQIVSEKDSQYEAWIMSEKVKPKYRIKHIDDCPWGIRVHETVRVKVKREASE